jgi:UDP-N-acetylmuramoyl-L-alanyl-D-glutamate--2,6-diaminopimelate ligase
MLTIDYTKFSKITTDSRQVSQQSIFVCIKGVSTDGHQYIKPAIENGAAHIVISKEFFESNQVLIEDFKTSSQVDFEITEDTSLKLTEILKAYYKNALEKVTLYGVTGTNGKTTITHLIQELMSDKQGSCAMLGTIGFKASPNKEYEELTNTTPAREIVYDYINQASQQGANSLTMEVSSHALDQGRSAGLNFKHAIVSNLTQDHLDYHQTMDNYFEAKAKLLEQTEDQLIVNLDDSYAQRFMSKAKASITVSLKNKEADLYASKIEISDGGLCYEVTLSEAFKTAFKISVSSFTLKTKLNGIFNVYNTLLASTLALIEGMDTDTLADRLVKIEPISGRFETITEPQKPLCIVDYAHSPDGLKNILTGARALIDKTAEYEKLICIFGCGGDRDITKRPIMASIAYELSDYVYVTSDNPRTEDPAQIISDILAGMPNLDKVKVLENRAEAIAEAIRQATANDVIVVAGKGHEDYQILKDKTIDFDDRLHVKEALKASSSSQSN